MILFRNQPCSFMYAAKNLVFWKSNRPTRKLKQFMFSWCSESNSRITPYLHSTEVWGEGSEPLKGRSQFERLKTGSIYGSHPPSSPLPPPERSCLLNLPIYLALLRNIILLPKYPFQLWLLLKYLSIGPCGHLLTVKWHHTSSCLLLCIYLSLLIFLTMNVVGV